MASTSRLFPVRMNSVQYPHPSSVGATAAAPRRPCSASPTASSGARAFSSSSRSSARASDWTVIAPPAPIVMPWLELTIVRIAMLRSALPFAAR